METMKLNVSRCVIRSICDQPTGPKDRAAAHLWSSEPTIEITECGPVAWWTCGRCPARVLHDPETEDGFPEEPIVVYPPSCFDFDGDAEEITLSDGSAMTCGCPRRASGDVVHLHGCVEDEVQLQSAALMAEPEPASVIEEHHREPASVVHPPTDPAPPSEELARAIEEAAACPGCGEELLASPNGVHCDQCGWEPAGTPSERGADEQAKAFRDVERELDEDDIPTQRYPASFVESGGSIFERIEALFGRPFKLGDDAGMDLAFDALGGIEG